MGSVFVVGYNSNYSAELRAKRQLSVRLTTAEPISTQYVLVAYQGIPVWLAEVESFSAPPGEFPKVVSINLGQIVYLEDEWSKVSQILPLDVDIAHGKIVSLDIDQFLILGDKLPIDDSPRGPTLSASDAKARLAWTYGVSEPQVKITIDL